MSGKKHWKLKKTTRMIGSGLLAVLMLVSIVAINAPSVKERGYAMSAADTYESSELSAADDLEGAEFQDAYEAEDSATDTEDAEQQEDSEAEESDDAESENSESEEAEDADQQDAEESGEKSEDAEAENAAVEEEEQGEEAEELLIKGDRILTAEGENYTVTAAFGADAGIPENAELKVELIDPKSKEYQERFDFPPER